MVRPNLRDLGGKFVIDIDVGARHTPTIHARVLSRHGRADARYSR